MWAGRAANDRARSTQRVRGSLLKRLTSIRYLTLASFHLLRFAPNSFSFRSSSNLSIEVHSPPSSLFRISTRIEIERRGWNVLLSRSIDSRLDLFEASNFQENLRGAEIKRGWKAWSLTVRCFLLSRLRDCPSPVPSYSFREKEEEVDREYRD